MHLRFEGFGSANQVFFCCIGTYLSITNYNLRSIIIHVFIFAVAVHLVQEVSVELVTLFLMQGLLFLVQQ